MSSIEPTSAPHELTVDEWADLDEETPGELVDGRLEEEETPTGLHEAAAAWILWKLSGAEIDRLPETEDDG